MNKNTEIDNIVSSGYYVHIMKTLSGNLTSFLKILTIGVNKTVSLFIKLEERERKEEKKSTDQIESYFKYFLKIMIIFSHHEQQVRRRPVENKKKFNFLISTTECRRIKIENSKSMNII